MAVGFGQTKGDIDSRAGSLAVALREDFYKITLFKSWLDTKTTEDLTTLGYTEGEVAILKSAYTDLADLALAYQGQASAHLAGTYDYRTFAKQLTGTA